MFGILHYQKRAAVHAEDKWNDKNGAETGFLYAFSGQYNGIWLVDGWMPPPFSVAKFQEINRPLEREIKQLTREIAGEKSEEHRSMLRKKRRHLSQNLNTALQCLTILHNFRGEKKKLVEIFGKRGIPTGTGECCTPKLLNFAAKNGLQPLGLCEFFIGQTTKSGSCRHGRFYPPCSARCLPLLGFMLCGIDGESKKNRGNEK